MNEKRRYPIGAEFSEKGVSFRVWAPDHSQITLILENPARKIPLKKEPKGYFSAFVPLLQKGALYTYEINKKQYPDPASRYQPRGIDGPSAVVDPIFAWSDNNWPGIEIQNQIAYEMHIGTFTQEGTFSAAIQHLNRLAELGITLIEIMPLNEFPGKFGWGYDGIQLFAPYHHYGEPNDLKNFIDKAHHLKIGVILDVVYNHFGPEGNFLPKFSKCYMHPKEKTEWGDAINFDNASCREFFLSNARYWIEEFHFDGLRVDATPAFFCKNKPHFLAELSQTVRKARPTKKKIIIGENEKQDDTLLKTYKQNGYQFDAVWNDDFHHTALVRLKGKREAYYIDYLGSPQEFISSLKYGFLYQGQYYEWQKQKRGSLQLQSPRESKIIFLENHDQVGNTSTGRRLHQQCDPGNYRAMTALMLLGPNVPMLFQGQEFGSNSPFYYFADHNDQLNLLIQKGRKKFLSQFPHITKKTKTKLKNPSDYQTFLESKLNYSEKEKKSPIYQLHQDLIQLRKNDEILKNAATCPFDGVVLSEDAFAFRFFGSNGRDRLLIINFGIDFYLNPEPEPLMATSKDWIWEIIWSSDALEYGGEGICPLNKPHWKIFGHAAILLQPSQRTIGVK